MFRLAVLSFVLVAVVGQRATKRQAYNGDPQIAAILQEQRYQSGDGTFGAAYQQEDGIDFKEESDAAGNRKGSYSYVDPSGQRRTVHYTAGKNGFQATGDHLPQAPAAPAPVAPQPQYTPQPQYNSPQQVPQGGRNYNAIPNVDDGQYHPELYEREDSNSSPQINYNPAPQQQYQQPQQYTAPQQYKAPQQYQAPQQQNIYPGVQQAQYSGVQNQQYSAPQTAPQRFYDQTTPPPSRFFPPGKFNLNRSPDGYTYTFSKQ